MRRDKIYDIGGQIELILTKTDSGYIGEYKRKGKAGTYIFDGSGMTKKQIITRFWDNVKEVS